MTFWGLILSVKFLSLAYQVYCHVFCVVIIAQSANIVLQCTINYCNYNVKSRSSDQTDLPHFPLIAGEPRLCCLHQLWEQGAIDRGVCNEQTKRGNILWDGNRHKPIPVIRKVMKFRNMKTCYLSDIRSVLTRHRAQDTLGSTDTSSPHCRKRKFDLSSDFWLEHWLLKQMQV